MGDPNKAKLIAQFERLLAAVLQPRRNYARLWYPFRLLENVPLVLPIDDHFCCFGSEWHLPENLTHVDSVTVRLTEAVLCPGGGHKIGFDGYVYRATVSAEDVI